MIKPSDPRQLAVDILERSVCLVRVGAAIADGHGILSWGWNNVGTGFGQHAECHAIGRASQKRLSGATIYVASARTRRDRLKTITSKPCEECQAMIDKWDLQVVWRDKEGNWIYE